VLANGGWRFNSSFKELITQNQSRKSSEPTHPHDVLHLSYIHPNTPYTYGQSPSVQRQNFIAEERNFLLKNTEYENKKSQQHFHDKGDLACHGDMKKKKLQNLTIGKRH
jgi:hypothetical protein